MMMDEDDLIIELLKSQDFKDYMKGVQEAAMDLMGYVVVAEDGWIVKKYADGTVERLKQYKPDVPYPPLTLD